jgi:hypothetical protein
MSHGSAGNKPERALRAWSSDMPTSRVIVFLAAAVLAGSPIFAQDFTHAPKVSGQNELPGKPLIVWSETQKPNPLPQTTLALHEALEPTGQLEAADRRSPEAFRAMVARNGAGYALTLSSGRQYQVENWEKVETFRGRTVEVVGTLDPRLNTTRVISIQ